MFLETDFLKKDEIRLKLTRTAEGDPQKQRVPAYYFDICTLSGQKLGTCDLRIGHNNNTYYGGNIGYSIDEPHRGRHYAAKACLLLFELAKKHQMDHLIITCHPNNYASRKTCELAGGILKEIAELPTDSEMREDGRTHNCIYYFEWK